MFEERLKSTLKAIVTIFLVLLISLVVMLIVAIPMFLGLENKEVITIYENIAFGTIAFTIVAISIGAIVFIYQFIIWLFVEPFRDNNNGE